MSAPTEPEHTSNLQEAARAAVAGVMVGLPATVLSYDSVTQTASVRVVPCFRRRDPSNGGLPVCYRPPDLHNLPVGFPGGDAWGMTWPLTAGDTGRVVVLDRSIDEWKASGAATTEPQDPRRHDLTDAVFAPDIAPPGAPRASDSVDASAMVIRGAEIKMGSASASDFVALSSLVESEIAALWTAMNTHVHSGVTSGAAITAVSGTAGSAGSVAATKVKAE